MISQNSRVELNDLLFDNFISNDEYIKNMQSICKDLKPKIYPEKMSKIFNNRLDIAVIQNSEIYFLSKYFYKSLQDKLINGKTKDEKNYNEIEKLKESINPSNFFTDNEIEEYKGLDNIDYTIVKNDSAVVLNDVVEIITGREWRSAKVSIQDLKSFMDRNKITYNPNTQRPTEKRLDKKSGTVKERISTNKKSIKEIKQLIIDEAYYPPTITFNILSNDLESFKFEDGILNINSEIDLIDGWHNYTALMGALSEKPEIELYYKVDIYRMDEVTARNFIAMRNKQNIFKVESESYYDISNVYNFLANDINTEGTNMTNLLKNKLGKEIDEVELLGKYCTFKVLSKAIQDNFKLDKTNIIARQNLKKYLIDFFNIVISMYKKDFDSISNSRKTSFVTVNNMFYGYIALAQKLQNKEDWQELLQDTLSNIIFDKTSDDWKNKGLTMKDITGKQLSALYNYFYNLIPNNEEEVASDGR